MSNPPLPSPRSSAAQLTSDVVAHARPGRSAPCRRSPAAARRRRPRVTRATGPSLSSSATVPRRRTRRLTRSGRRSRASRRASSRALRRSRSRPAGGCARCRWRRCSVGRPGRHEDVGVAAAAGGHVARLDAQRLERRRGDRHRRRVARHPVAAVLSSTAVSTSHSASLAASVSASTIALLTVRRRCSWSRLRASSATSQRSATTLAAVPPLILPTLAVVSGSTRPSSIRAIGSRRPPRSRCGPPRAVCPHAPHGPRKRASTR